MDIKIDKLQLEEFDHTIDPSKYFGKWFSDEKIGEQYRMSKPFNHIVIENFLTNEYADEIYDLFQISGDGWYKYLNPLEVKFAFDRINSLPKKIRDLFYILSTDRLTKRFAEISGIDDLEYDPYLHGAGLHAHPRYGRLNLHLDYEQHPITEKERKINIILYLSKDWDTKWNGETELWEKDMSKCAVKTEVKFNRAIIFQTNEVSYHGLPEKILCPEGTYRKSLAYYYVSPLKAFADTKKFGATKDGYRTKASFIKRPLDPYSEQMKKLYEIRPYRRIEETDMMEIWPEWTPELF